MSVRNSTELGEYLLKIMNSLLENQPLLRLLKYADENPLSSIHEDIDKKEVKFKNIKVTPLVKEDNDNTESEIVLLFESGSIIENKDFKDIKFSILVYTPLSEWLINEDSLRPFLIMSEIEKTLKGKRINGIGILDYQGFDLNIITDVISCYKMEFTVNAYN